MPSTSRLLSEQYWSKPTRNWPLNGLTAVDWSPDGRVLVLEVCSSNETHLFDRGLVLYTVERDRKVRVNFTKAFSRWFSKDCSAVVLRSIRGFNQAGEVVIEVIDWIDPYDPDDPETAAAGCVTGQASLWALDWRRGAVRPLPEQYEITRFGTGLK